MLTLRFAKEHLSDHARARGENWGGYLCFEEDCAHALVDWELPEFWPETFRYAKASVRNDPRAYLLQNLSIYNLSYLEAIGQEPDAEAVARHEAFNARIKAHKAEREAAAVKA